MSRFNITSHLYDARATLGRFISTALIGSFIAGFALDVHGQENNPDMAWQKRVSEIKYRCAQVHEKPKSNNIGNIFKVSTSYSLNCELSTRVTDASDEKSRDVLIKNLQDKIGKGLSTCGNFSYTLTANNLLDRFSNQDFHKLLPSCFNKIITELSHSCSLGYCDTSQNAAILARQEGILWINIPFSKSAPLSKKYFILLDFDTADKLSQFFIIHSFEK